jgi:diguanylate cyclase (GGDEF)-like protein/PAS domain S-box-containing protein
VAGYTHFPAPSDLFYLCLGPCVALGLKQEVDSHASKVQKKFLWLDMVMLTTAMLTLVLVLYLPKGGATAWLPMLVLIAYPSTLLAAAITALSMIPNLRLHLNPGFILFICGLIATGLSWMNWNLHALEGNNIDGAMLNTLFSVAVLVMAYALTRWKIDIDHDPEWDRQCETALRLLPMLTVAVAAFSVILSHTLGGLPYFVQATSDAGAIIVMLLALIRQVVMMRERDQLQFTQLALINSQKDLAQFKDTLDCTLDGVFVYKTQSLRLIYVNQGAIQQTGYGQDELLRMTPVDITPEFTEQRYRSLLQPLLDGSAESLSFETEHQHKNGHTIPVEIGLQIIRKEGQSSRFIAIARDITIRRQAEAELRIAAVAFESQEILMITDANGVILRVNQAFTDNTGYTAEEAIGQTPRLLKSGRHDREFYRAMWDSIDRTGAWEGEIWDRRKNGEIYPKWLTISAVKAANGVVTHYVASHIDITARKAAEEEIQHLAFYDPLTNLPNRRLLMDRLQHATASSARSGRSGALLFIDLDHFKTLNDTLGHQIGDVLLQQVAQRLVACVREGDTVARLGGDEFMLILEDLNEQVDEAAAQTEIIGEKVLVTLSKPYLLAAHECRSTSSIGATLFKGHESTLEELMKQADIAMYQSKKSGRNTLRFFDPAMQASINAHATLESDIRLALEEQQFQLYFQIQVDSSHRALGAEVLIRWIQPERGLVSPQQFIPLAEEMGLILPIGQWVLDTACIQLKRWRQYSLTRDLVLAVNVSARQFHQTDFVTQVQATVQRHGIDPGRLKLELTESMLLESIDATVATMNALSEIGVSLSLDDFGTGYSSLQYLKMLPLDQLKIDKSFVRDIDTNSGDLAIVKTIIAMARSMELDVIAEGVETEAQRQLLLDSGCTHFQGYLFSQPVPIEQFEALLKLGDRVEA